MAYSTDYVVDYGTLGPQDFDRFGLANRATVHSGHHPEVVQSHNPRSRVKRLGLTLLGWTRRIDTRHENYFMEVNGRSVEIRSYHDGRIRLFLDGREVYGEKYKTITRKGNSWHELHEYFDQEVLDQEQEVERQQRFAAIRNQMQQRKQQINNSSTASGT